MAYRKTGARDPSGTLQKTGTLQKAGKPGPKRELIITGFLLRYTK